MDRRPFREILAMASEQTLERIHRLRAESVRPKVAMMLAHIARHLTDQDLSIRSIREACGLRDNSVALEFHSEVGQPPGAFISGCRAEVAEKLLRHSKLAVWQIAELLGFSSIQVFSRSFRGRTGTLPSVFRKNNRLGGSQ